MTFGLESCLFSENFPIFITHHDCLPKRAKFVYKNTRQSVAFYQSPIIENKMLLIISHLTIKNNLKVEKRIIISKTSKTPSSKKRLGYAHKRRKGAIPPNF